MTRYDVVVVGAGASGAPLAARLSEDPDRSVLLLEAGADAAARRDYPRELLDASVMSAAMPGHPANWGFTAELAPGLPYTVARGRVLGGSTALNGGYFIRARDTDLARWAAAGNPAWAPERVLPVFRALERDLDYGETGIHGGSGPMPVRRELARPARLTTLFDAAARELGFADDPDKNDPSTLEGIGPLPVNIVDGVRINTGLGYVDAVRATRPNLTVQGGTLVHRVRIAGGRAIGVVAETDGRLEEIDAGEVVLAGGAIKSAHLLMLSGVGPAGQLGGVGVPVVMDAPVGAAFSDHPDITLNFRPAGRLDAARPAQLFESVLHLTASGSPTPGDLEIMPMLRPLGRAMAAGGGIAGALSRPLETLKGLRGVSKKRLAQQAIHADDLSLIVAVQQAVGRGVLELVSSDPHAMPAIAYRYLEEERDRTRMREALRTGARLLAADAFAEHVARLTELDEATLGDDAALDAWARGHLGTAIHMCGTAPMGPSGDPAAVVDQFGRVHGVTGLRVADTSILPDTPSRGPAATAVMIGEFIAAAMRRGD
ncbi:GMC oxidoreductase [Agromyces archimandritae]|uniref:GMC family oxidoreductase N-terminal domain-containing protein n=1 Tax=Agromyces archimandritae TaxID=2781962 RepID=A0A975FLA4_9MICO|nr:GMC oxidoreductase [Agromyces archimandritae]QTX03827.1 GMC family oxidoreductase N-terminal domain-containing protein [Agromyces archimandritae]